MRSRLLRECFLAGRRVRIQDLELPKPEQEWAPTQKDKLAPIGTIRPEAQAEPDSVVRAVGGHVNELTGLH